MIAKRVHLSGMAAVETIWILEGVSFYNTTEKERRREGEVYRV